MKSIRVFGVGLMLSGGITISAAHMFFQWWIGNESFHAYGMVLHNLAPSINATTGYGGVAIAVLLMLSLGLGLFLAATFYASLESRVLATLEAWKLRNDESDRAKALRAMCLPWLKASKA